MTAPDTFPNVCCWDPTSRPKVMDTVALHVSDPVFMATHYPCPIQRVNPESRQGEPYSEEQFLRDFLDEHSDHVFSIVYGDSGTGKSHLIRWMARALDDSPSCSSGSAHVVLVPRESANLAAVLMRILEGCTGPVATDLRRKISESREKLTVRGAMTQVLDALAFVLEPENLTNSGLEFPDDEEHELIVELLPHLLRAQPVRRDLLADREGVVSRIARHVSREKRDIRPDEEGAPLWCSGDLAKLAPQPPSTSGDDWKELCNCLVTDEGLRETAAAVLNRALTEALPRLMGVRRGDLAEALVEIRKLLATQGKSLVLLIEDLSVAQGVDEELIECLLPGQFSTSLCPLRSVIGITNDDFERLQSNIAGRVDIAVCFSAKVSTGGNGEGAFSSSDMLDFASRYLNAVRFSARQLSDWHDGASPGELPPSYCHQTQCPNLETCHATFGAVDGRGLYPLSPDAILRLYQVCQEQDMMATEKSVFKPRRLVSRVLSPLLAAGERDIPAGRFPSGRLRHEFGLKRLGATRQQELKERYSGDMAERIAAAWEIYADDPFSGSVPSPVLEAFGLPEEAGSREPGTAVDATAQGGVLRSQGQDLIRERPPSGPDEFDSWANGDAVSNRRLNDWRSALYSALADYEDWDCTPCFTFLFKDCFGQRYIEFEGQRTKTENGLVLQISRSSENAIAMRTLVAGCEPNDVPSTVRTLEFLASTSGQLRQTFENELRKGGRATGRRMAVHSLCQVGLVSGSIPGEAKPEDAWSALLSKEYEILHVEPDPFRTSVLRDAVRASKTLRGMASSRKGGQAGALMDAGSFLPEVRSAIRLASPMPPNADKVSRALYGDSERLCQTLATRLPAWLDHMRDLSQNLVHLSEDEAQGEELAVFIDALRSALSLGHSRFGLSSRNSSILDDLASLDVSDEVVRSARSGVDANRSENDRLAALSRLPGDAIQRLLRACREAEVELARLEAEMETEADTVAGDPVMFEGRLRESLDRLAGALSALAD